jgi:GMP synthase (glutamine-hydrolysing)
VQIVAIRHVAFEDLGVWASTLRGRGHEVSYLDAGDDYAQAARADLLIVLGGPIGLADHAEYPFLNDEVDMVKERLARDAPTLGVCLGAQIMASALGARVFAGDAKEIGWGILSLTPAAATSPIVALADAPVLHWHGDTFDLPRGATLLASTSATPHQAFAHGRSLALQFHTEVMGSLIERWLVGHAVELHAAGVNVTALRQLSLRHALPAARAGRAFLDAYLDTLEVTP